MNFGFPGMFNNFNMVNPRLQAINQLKAIKKNKQAVIEVQEKTNHLEKEKQKLIHERDNTNLKNTYDHNQENRIRNEVITKTKSLLLTQAKPRKIIWFFRILLLVLTFTGVLAYLLVALPTISVVFDVLSVVKLFIVYMLLLSILIWITDSKYDSLKANRGKSLFKTFGIIFIIYIIAYCIYVFGALSLSPVIAPFPAQLPFWLLSFIMQISLCMIEIASYRRCSKNVYYYQIQMLGMIRKAKENDCSAQAQYQKDNTAFRQRRYAEYSPKISQKDAEIAANQLAIAYIPTTCPEYNIHPYLKEKSISYISILIDLIEEGKADSVKEAMNLQSELSYRADIHFQNEMNKLRQEKFLQDLAYEQKQANIKLENEANLTRKAEEKKAEELEKIRRQLEDN